MPLRHTSSVTFEPGLTLATIGGSSPERLIGLPLNLRITSPGSIPILAPGPSFCTEPTSAGATGYFYQQITADSGPGATLGPFISRVAGVGPQLGYDFAHGHRSVSISARGYYEFAGQNRPQGFVAWLTFVVSLGVPGQKPAAP